MDKQDEHAALDDRARACIADTVQLLTGGNVRELLLVVHDGKGNCTTRAITCQEHAAEMCVRLRLFLVDKFGPEFTKQMLNTGLNMMAQEIKAAAELPPADATKH